MWYDEIIFFFRSWLLVLGFTGNYYYSCESEHNTHNDNKSSIKSKFVCKS